MSSPKLKNVDAVLSRLKSYLHVETDDDLAGFMGLARSSVSAWRTRKTVNLKLVAEKCPDLNMQWLLYGNAPENAPMGELGDLVKQLHDVGAMNHEIVGILKRATELAQAARIVRENNGEPVDQKSLDDVMLRAIISEAQVTLAAIRGSVTHISDLSELSPDA